MAVRFQLVIDCTDPDLLARFWAAALGMSWSYPRLASPPGMTTGATLEFPRPNWEPVRTASSIPMAAGRHRVPGGTRGHLDSLKIFSGCDCGRCRIGKSP